VCSNAIRVATMASACGHHNFMSFSSITTLSLGPTSLSFFLLSNKSSASVV
jgi:hypothetical protein